MVNIYIHLVFRDTQKLKGMGHNFERIIFIIIYYLTSFKVKIWLDHFGS